MAAPQQNKMEIVKYTKNCYHIKNFLSILEQIELYEGVLYSQSKCPISELKNKNKYSTMLMRINLMNKLNGKDKFLEYRAPIYTQLFSKLLSVTKRKLKTEIPVYDGINGVRLQGMKGLQYHYSDGQLCSHYDCRDGYVAIFSLGCQCNFFIKTEQMERSKIININSGDVIMFASNGLKHGIRDIDRNTCINHILSNKYPLMNDVRVSMQIRFEDKKRYK